MKEKILTTSVILWQTRRQYIIGGGVVILFVVCLFLIFWLFTKPVTQPKLAPVVRTAQNNVMPSLQFQTLKNTTSLPTVPSITKIYQLKNNFSPTEVQALAKKFGMQDISSTEGNVVTAYNLTDMARKGYLVFDRSTGSFTFQSYGSIFPNNYTPGETQQTEALDYLQQIGIADPTVACQTIYKSKQPVATAENLTFVECHRNWVKLGLPDYSPAGLLNLSDGESIASLSIGKTSALTPADPSIFDVYTDGIRDTSADGYTRPSDWGTATVVLKPDGSIYAASSNLRWITGKPMTTTPSEFLTPLQALNQFTANHPTLSLTAPAGSGNVSLAAVYPNNQAQAKTATITSYTLSYLEKPAGVAQAQLVPMYTIFGYANLNSGYRVKFTETVPALKTGDSFLAETTATQEVAAAETGPSIPSGLQMRAFNPLTPTVTVPITPLTTQPLTQKPVPLTTQAPQDCTTANAGSRTELLQVVSK